MKLLAWTVAAFVFLAVGISSVGAYCVGLACLCGGVWELYRRDNKEKK